MKAIIQRDIWTPMFSFIYNSQDVEATQVSLNKWIGKEDVVYNGILLGIKKNVILPFATMWLDVEGIMLSKTNQTKTSTACYH